MSEVKTFSTRAFTFADYEAALDLWTKAEGLEVAEGDTRDEIARYLKRNPGLSRIAEDETGMIGAVLCGHDGRRGWIYHLAVEPKNRGRGIGARLVDECLAGLRRYDVRRALILVAAENAIGRSFWNSCGWEEVPGAEVMGIDL